MKAVPSTPLQAARAAWLMAYQEGITGGSLVEAVVDAVLAHEARARQPRVFRSGDPEPGVDVRAVLDRDGDVWRRSRIEPRNWRYFDVDGAEVWPDLMACWGPLVEVVLPEPVLS